MSADLEQTSSQHRWLLSAYEAWELQGDGGLAAMRYLCGPGGGSPWG